MWPNLYWSNIFLFITFSRDMYQILLKMVSCLYLNRRHEDPFQHKIIREKKSTFAPFLSHFSSLWGGRGLLLRKYSSPDYAPATLFLQKRHCLIQNVKINTFKKHFLCIRKKCGSLSMFIDLSIVMDIFLMISQKSLITQYKIMIW